MKVKELIEQLSKLPSDYEVILQKDAEGNGYSPLSDVDGECLYRAESTWSGDVYSLSWSHSDACMEETEWEEAKSTWQKVVVLAPVN